MQVYSGKRDDLGLEKNDCVVRAFANITGTSYQESRKIMKDGGRTFGDGMLFTDYLPIFEKNNIFPISFHGRSPEASYIRKLRKNVYWKADRLNVGFVLSNLPKEGKFAVVLKEHIFAFIGGNIYDTEIKGGLTDRELNEEVIGVFEFLC